MTDTTDENEVREKFPGESVALRMSDQQTLVWERMKRGRDEAEAANESLSGRASTIVASAGVMFTVSAFLTGNAAAGNGTAMAVFAGIAGAVFLASMFLASSIWLPADADVPGSTDVCDLYETYMAGDVDDALWKMMATEAEVFDAACKRNVFIAKRLQSMIYLLDAQAVFLLIVAILPALSR